MGLRVFVHVFGCRSSLCEGEYIAGALSAHGVSITEDLSGKIDGAVIVTCSVTQEADRKCRQLVRRVRRVLGDSGVLAVCGCWSQSLSDDAAREMGIDILAGSKGKNTLPEIMMTMLNEGRKFIDVRTQNIFTPSDWEELSIDSPVMHSRAFMKIQDGCNHFCTYCIIPYLRGRPVSRPTESILSEIHRLIDNGCNEVVFTGIHLGIYGQDINTSLAELVSNVSEIEGLNRLRLGSLEPFCLSDDLLSALNECDAFCPHLHLPMQSGDDNVLSRMRRGYTASEFVGVCEKARSVLGDDLHISSDILVGFPGESESAFMNTLNVMRDSGLGRVHVFPYSERRGTLAAEMPGQVPHAEKVSRTSRAIALGQELYTGYVSRFVGRDAEVLIETGNRGHTRHYIDAECDGMDNEIVKVRVKGAGKDGRLECVRRD
ncbi:MAG: MiaB/RimO family radical SAM methylthiotransferase [Synergistaceae bacterium]|nr:MiaB/RimO family radical SAM methylthiotransferase [Synergistaceae bacterium]